MNPGENHTMASEHARSGGGGLVLHLAILWMFIAFLIGIATRNLLEVSWSVHSMEKMFPPSAYMCKGTVLSSGDRS